MFKKGDEVYYRDRAKGVNREFTGRVKDVTKNSKYGDYVITVEWHLPKKNDPNNKFTNTYPETLLTLVSRADENNPNWAFCEEKQKAKEKARLEEEKKARKE